MCHHNSFLLFDVLDNPTQKRWNLVTHISIGISCMIIVIFGICGYVTFTGSVQGMQNAYIFIVFTNIMFKILHACNVLTTVIRLKILFLTIISQIIQTE